MKLHRTFQLPLALLSVVPLINVLFLVLVFFAIGSRFVLQPGLAVSLPVSSFALTPERAPQIVSITAVPLPAIYHRDRRVTLEELSARLAEVGPKNRALILKADRRTPYEQIVQVMNVALDRGFSVVLAAAPEHR